jgi:hypothetical protein
MSFRKLELGTGLSWRLVERHIGCVLLSQTATSSQGFETEIPHPAAAIED